MTPIITDQPQAGIKNTPDGIALHMDSFVKHRQVARRLIELSDTLVAELAEFKRVQQSTRPPPGVADSIDRSTEWLQQAVGPTILAICNLKTARFHALASTSKRPRDR